MKITIYSLPDCPKCDILKNFLNSEKITKESPSYVQRLNKKNLQTMLHLEIYNSKPKKNKMYQGGNWFNKKKPNNLLNPIKFL